MQTTDLPQDTSKLVIRLPGLRTRSMINSESAVDEITTVSQTALKPSGNDYLEAKTMIGTDIERAFESSFTTVSELISKIEDRANQHEATIMSLAKKIAEDEEIIERLTTEIRYLKTRDGPELGSETGSESFKLMLEEEDASPVPSVPCTIEGLGPQLSGDDHGFCSHEIHLTGSSPPQVPVSPLPILGRQLKVSQYFSCSIPTVLSSGVFRARYSGIECCATDDNPELACYGGFFTSQGNEGEQPGRETGGSDEEDNTRRTLSAESSSENPKRQHVPRTKSVFGRVCSGIPDSDSALSVLHVSSSSSARSSLAQAPQSHAALIHRGPARRCRWGSVRLGLESRDSTQRQAHRRCIGGSASSLRLQEMPTA
ncbi:hypothetical protein C8R47DRAFT_1069258 [Mycena vitilis]|nr:hypothetical protein C8R47DRAFT_1069258 [Mycena vitilis]